MHKSRLAGFVIDCKTADLDAEAAFWSEALGCPIKDRGTGENAGYISLSTPDDQPIMLLQQVDHDSRVHLDIETDDLEAEARRLEKLGAKRVAAIKGWIVMEAPSGHRFCVVDPQRPDFAEGAGEWPSA